MILIAAFYLLICCPFNPPGVEQPTKVLFEAPSLEACQKLRLVVTRELKAAGLRVLTVTACEVLP